MIVVIAVLFILFNAGALLGLVPGASVLAVCVFNAIGWALAIIVGAATIPWPWRSAPRP